MMANQCQTLVEYYTEHPHLVVSAKAAKAKSENIFFKQKNAK